MAISLESLRSSTSPVPPRLLNYGVAGIGKTSWAASAPGAVALVERGPTVTTNHTYVSRRLGDVEDVRLHVLLRGPV